jgi:hypothetical protein
MVEVEPRAAFFGETGGVFLGDRPKNPFLADAGDGRVGIGAVVLIVRGSLFELIAFETDAENDLDRGRAAKKPGRGPAVESSVGGGEVTLLCGKRDGAARSV